MVPGIASALGNPAPAFSFLYLVALVGTLGLRRPIRYHWQFSIILRTVTANYGPPAALFGTGRPLSPSR